MAKLPWDMQGKVVLITGGNAGIGLGFARGIAKAGGDLVIWGRRKDANDAAKAELEALGARVLAQEVDVSDEARVIEAFAEAVDTMGRVDGAIANAGLMRSQGSFTNMTSEAWHGLLAVNQHGAFHVAREAARHMRKRAEAGDPGGSILFCASLSAVTGSIGMQHYNASKGAMAALARGIAVDMGKFGIRANTVCPGYTESETVKDPGPDSPLGAQVRERCPLGRFGNADDFEGIGVYFMSDASRYHSGDIVLVDGGWMANAGKLDTSAERRA
jgi:NAD(P)-dependent dehydrogenase (short-subunit alcohol dehydrogenase family)